MNRRTRLFSLGAFLLCTISLSVLTRARFESYFPAPDLESLWFYSGLTALLLAIFFVEPYYSAPVNTTVNSVTILLVLVSVFQQLPSDAPHVRLAWSVGLVYAGVVLVASVVATVAGTSQDAGYTQNLVSRAAKFIALRFGSAKVLFSGMFLGTFLLLGERDAIDTIWMVGYWWVIVAANPHALATRLAELGWRREPAVGEIFGVLSRDVFLARLYNQSKHVDRDELVRFSYSMRDDGHIHTGIVFDSYFLNQEKWLKVLQLGSENGTAIELEKNKVYPLNEVSCPRSAALMTRLTGIVTDRTTIGSIIFECFSHERSTLQEGDLVEVRIGNTNVVYQVVGGVAETQRLEGKDETGFIRAEAVQLGVWNPNSHAFEKYGWLPQIHTPVLRASFNEMPAKVAYPHYSLGVVPGTRLPCVIDLNTAVSHHMAILGVTGAGKSFICREIIKEVARGAKVICVDFTGEYKKELSTLGPVSVMDNPDALPDVEKKLAEKSELRSRSGSASLRLKEEIREKLLGYVERFSAREERVGIFELPDLSNSTFILEFTQMFLDAVFQHAKSRFTVGEAIDQICIVIEEAHTVVPETSSLGDFGDFGSNKALVNKIGQIALQGRKYGVGFIVIAQRTANVSKTVLTQCNSVICFQAFDQTSYLFLENYVGKEMVEALAQLKPYHAVVAGKAAKSNVPMIVDLTRRLDHSSDGPKP